MGCNSNCRYSPLVKGAGFRLLSPQAPAVAHSALRTGLAMRQFELHPYFGTLKRKGKLNGKKQRTANKGFCNIGADEITMSICNSIWHLFGQTSFNLAFCSYLRHHFFNWASVTGGRFSNSPTSQSPVRWL